MPFDCLVNRISVIIPTLNEADNLAPTLEPLVKSGVHEIIIVDAGSTDGTAEIASKFDVSFKVTPKEGRAQQMNYGAEIATGEVLLFLHADTLVPESALQQLAIKLEHPEVIGGGFERFFDSQSVFLRLTCRLANHRSRRSGIFLGDQGIFVRTIVFKTLNGYNKFLAYGEDLDFSLWMREMGETIAISPPVLSSARRFEKLGPLLQTLKDLWLTAKILYFRKRIR